MLYYQAYSGFIVVCVRPVAMELDNVRMLELGEILKDELDLLLLRLEVLPLGELYFIPHHLDALLGVHRQVGAVDARHISLFYLHDTKKPHC